MSSFAIIPAPDESFLSDDEFSHPRTSSTVFGRRSLVSAEISAPENFRSRGIVAVEEKLRRA